MTVALFDTATPLSPLLDEIKARIAEVIDRGVYILGEEVAAFEEEFAAYLGVKHVIGVANGTDAITIALRALGVTPGDEVVVPAFTFFASVEAIVNAGATPRFCDVDFDTRNVTVQTVRAALSSNVKAVLAVDLFGAPAPVPELQALGLPVLEDAAQAAGAGLRGVRAGALGDVATFSFYPSKNLGCFGDGGAIATDDDDLAALARTLRFHGSRDKRTFERTGYNSRLDEVQASILRLLLPHLDGWAEQRREVAETYRAVGLGEHVSLPGVPQGASPAWHLYVVTHPEADGLVERLGAQGVQARGYYRIPVHRQPAIARHAQDVPALEVTDRLAATNLALPMSPALDARRCEQVVEATRLALST